MKKNLIKSFSVAALIGIMFSCDKQEIKLAANSSEINSTVTTKNSNQVNPYNYLGEIHNEVLQEAIQSNSYDQLSKMDKVLWTYERVNVKMIEKGYSYNVVPNPEQYIDLQKLQLLPDQEFDPETYFNQVVSNLSQIEQKQIGKLIKQFEIYEINHNLNMFNSNITALENSVNQNASITAQSKKMILGAIAVGKASFIFWHGSDVPASKIKPWLADTGGFIVGAGTTIWGWFEGYEWGNPITNGVAAGTFASEVAKEK